MLCILQFKFCVFVFYLIGLRCLVGCTWCFVLLWFRRFLYLVSVVSGLFIIVYTVVVYIVGFVLLRLQSMFVVCG